MNHKAIVAAITEVIEIPGAEKIQAAKVLGETVVVSKDLPVGYVGVFFPVDLQLSEEFCRENNLFRHSHLNKDNTKVGFFDDNRRVRAQPFLKVKSSALFVGLDSISYTGRFFATVGEEFDELNGHKICEKYASKEAKEAKGNNAVKAAKKNYAPDFLKHVDSEQFKHYSQNIEKGSLIHFHSKVHGTSARMAYTKVVVDLPKWKGWINKNIYPFFADSKWDYVVGTRNVILKDAGKAGFHGAETFRFEVMELVKPHLTKGMSIYGEIAGYANGKPIMPVHSIDGLKDKAYKKKYGNEVKYAYGCKEHEYRFHIYRITSMNEEGEHIDYTQAQIDKWCANRGLLGPVEVHPPFVYDGDVEKLRALVEELTERPSVLTEDYIDPSHISEGIILRVDTGKLVPDFYKSKSYAFRVLEGLCSAVDTEEAS